MMFISSFIFIIFILLSSSSSADHVPSLHHLRTLGEHCNEHTIQCEPGLQCTLLNGKQTCRAPSTTEQPADERCLHVKCAVVFPDCAADSVPILVQPVASAEEEQFDRDPDDDQQERDECCPALVKCQCDPQKCLVPQCPEGTERVLVHQGRADQPGACCDRFECRQSELRCEHVRCPDYASLDLVDLYSPEGGACPPDSHRPPPYVPAGSCCPIRPQCSCRPDACEPARCEPGERLVVRKRGRGEPGRCCDEVECRPETEADEAGVCRHGNRTYVRGERWHSAPCQECQCAGGGVALCSHMECPKLAPDCSWVGLVPGECCPVCLGCRDDQGRTYGWGEHWARDGCTNCTCADHRWQCQKFICKTDCEHPVPVPGDCCPVCEEPTVVKEPATSGCPSLDQCPLRCDLGLVQNRRSGCFECKCTDDGTAKKQEGEGGEGERAEGGGGGREAQKCEPLTEHNCARLCAHGYLRDERGCALCRCAHCPPLMDGRCGKHCVHGYEHNSLGCPICKCRPVPEGALADQSSASASTSFVSIVPPTSLILSPADDGELADLRCTSSASAEERDIGEWWTDSGCWQCFCQQGKEFCSLISCPARAEADDQCPEEQWTRSTENQCCPSCVAAAPSSPSNSSLVPHRLLPPPLPHHHFSQVCHSPGTGQLFVDGETWRLDGGCVACTCRVGHVLCVWNDGNPCPAAPCERPILDPTMDQCCPRCPPTSAETTIATLAADVDEPPMSNISCVDDLSGVVQPVGAEWRRDVCHSCRCSADGNALCFRERCAGAEYDGCAGGRMLTLKGRCCPICSDALRAEGSTAVCIYASNVYASGEQFRDGPCRNCTCLTGGTIRCLEIHCAQRCGSARADAEGNGTREDAGGCCGICADQHSATDGGNSGTDPSSSSADLAVLYSSFEKGNEDQVLFIGGLDPRDPSVVASCASWFRRHMLPLVALTALLALAALLALGAASVMAVGGWRKGKKKVAGATGSCAPTRWLRNIVAQQPQQPKQPEDETGVATTTSPLLVVATKR